MAELVGIVLVSHSEQLASGLRDLLLQIGDAALPVAVAAGTDDGRLGTSYQRIAKAIASVDHGAGVIILTDLGSAVLTARAVLADRATDRAVEGAADWAAEAAAGTDARAAQRAEARDDVTLVDAPFVEGAVAAAVIAATGADLATVRAAAEEARDVRKL